MSDLLVQTAQGALRGRMRGDVAMWCGIPFAEPPDGPRRFLPPRPPLPWNGERDATRFGAVAPQSRDSRVAAMSGITDKTAMSEDCLTLNVYSPAADGARRPVMVWLHGGAFVMGAGSTPLYDGSSFAARHDIVVVTVNYRIGLLGFLYLGDIAGERYAAGNQGLLDQIAALAWVRDNIAAFGGDPDAVTVMGQSAGSISIANLLAAPAARGLFHRAILQSGASPLFPHTRVGATALARAVLDELGIDPSRAASELAAVPLERLLAAQEVAIQQGGLAAISPYVDGVTVPDRPIAIAQRCAGANVPAAHRHHPGRVDAVRPVPGPAGVGAREAGDRGPHRRGRARSHPRRLLRRAARWVGGARVDRSAGRRRLLDAGGLPCRRAVGLRAGVDVPLRLGHAGVRRATGRHPRARPAVRVERRPPARSRSSCSAARPRPRSRW